MADRLKSQRVVDPVLTSIARGYKNAQYIGEGLFPVAEAENRTIGSDSIDPSCFLKLADVFPSGKEDQ